ncbi:MAG: hypothetical protein WAJ92_03305 [Candidatus Acidiferrales bacterium]
MKIKFVCAIGLSALLAVTAASSALAQATALPASRKSKSTAEPDRLGLTCRQILQMSSSDWIAKYLQEKDSSTPRTKDGIDGATLRAIAAYGKCYDAQTDRLASKLGRSGKGPLMGVRGNFGDFEKAVKDFTLLTLRNSQPPADPVKSAYAALYEKQFRFAFYESYDPNAPKPPADASISSAAQQSNARTGALPAAKSPSAKTSGPAAAPPAADESAASVPPGNAGDFSKAKNHFGILLAALPPDQMHQLHASFGRILAANQVSQSTRLSVYRYAIFLLEPPSDKPFAPPPF